MTLFGKSKSKKKNGKSADTTYGKVREFRAKDTLVFRTLLRPHVTEKAHAGLAQNKYFFRVETTATKGAVKRAIEAAYGVHVEQVNIVNIARRGRFFRGRSGTLSGFKKAIVTVKEGETIDVFQGA